MKITTRQSRGDLASALYAGKTGNQSSSDSLEASEIHLPWMWSYVIFVFWLCPGNIEHNDVSCSVRSAKIKLIESMSLQLTPLPLAPRVPLPMPLATLEAARPLPP